MESIKDLLLKALALPDKIYSDRQTKIRALRKAIIKCVIRYDESANPKSKEFFENYDVDMDRSIAITSVEKRCDFIDRKCRHVTEYDLKGVCLIFEDISNEINIFPLCQFEDNENIPGEIYEGLNLNDYVEIDNALLNKIYETEAK